MKKRTMESEKSTRVDRVLTLAIVGVISLLMFGLAYTASAAPLYRQLQQGMSGSDVSDLQRFLATDTTVYPQGLVTGYFGSLTKTAVANFQTKNGISAVGRVGPMTMVAINAQMGSGSGLDMNAPVIGSLSVGTTNSTATMSWNTNENASATIYYSTSPLSMTEGSPTSGITVGGSNLLVSSDLRMTHSATITGLQSGTTYYYVAYSKDASGNETITWPNTFRTN